jgi:iron complex outermembrane receptor protein
VIDHSSTKQDLHYSGPVEDGRIVFFLVAVFLLLAMYATFSNVAAAAGAEEIHFNIPQQRADLSLTQFAEQADLTFIFRFNTAKKKTANKLDGRYSVDEAIRILLVGTGLQPVFSDQGLLMSVSDDRSAAQGDQTMEGKKAGFAALLATVFGSSPLNAQDAQEVVIDEILVTAQIREEDFQNIPVTGTIFDAATLENNRLMEFDDLARFTPGFSASYFNYSSPSFAVRGAMNTFSQAGASKPVGIFIDDVFVPRNSAGAFELFDVRQVSVLRGPQGTLFGRNVTGGAIQVYTEQPSLEQTELKFQLGAGNYDFTELSAFASGPISDTVAGKISVTKKDREGFSVDRFNGRDLEDQDSISVRAGLSIAASDNVEIRLAADFSNNENGGKGYSFVSNNAGTDFTGDDGDIRTSELRIPQSYDRDIFGISAHIDWTLDKGTFQSITAYRESDSHEFYSLGAADVTLPSVSTQFIKDDNDEPTALSQEFRYISETGDKFDFVGGVYFYDESTDRFLGDLLLGAGGNAQFVNRDFTVTADTKSIAAYMSATFHLGNRFDLGVGGRYTSEDKDVSVQFVDNNNGGNSFSTSPSNSFSEFTPRITLSFFPSDNVTIFASRTEGFTAGGFNTEVNNQSSTELGFDPETITAYELGAKTAWNNRRVLANLTFFDQDYKDKQEGVLLPGNIFSILNASDATMKGAELELVWVMTDSFSASATYSKLDTKYDSFEIPGGVNFTGNKLQTAPESTYSLALDYEKETRSGSLSAGLSYTWQDEYFTGASNVPEFLIDDFGLVNARLGYSWSDGKWAIKIWGKNLSDEDFVRIRGTSGALAEYFGPPRTYGVNFTYSN